MAVVIIDVGSTHIAKTSERSRPKGLDLDETPYGGLVKETVLCATVMAITLSK